MKKSKLIYATLLIPLSLMAKNYNITKTLDDYHILISKWVMDYSDDLDRYLSNAKDNKKMSNTSVSVAYEFGTNSRGGVTNDFSFSLSLSLPRLENKARIILEKVNKTTTLLENKEGLLSKKGDDLKDSYNLALQYSQWKGVRSNILLTGGVRFNKIFFEPYLGIVTGYTIKRTEKVEFNIKNTLRFYIAGEIKNNTSLQYFYLYSNDIITGWYGNIDYSNKSDEQNLMSEFLWHKRLDKYKFIRFGFVATAHLTNFKDPKKDDFKLYAKYHNRALHRDWLYYEITPSFDWRKRDDYKPSFGMKFKIGATFGGTK